MDVLHSSVARADERGANRGANRGADRGADRGAAASAPRSPALAGERGVVARASVARGVARGAATVARGAALDAESAIARLEEAGRAILSLPQSGYSTRLRIGAIQPIRSALESYGWDASPRLRPPMPDAATITRMDEAFGWIALIPEDRYVLRRIVGCRALVSPLTERYLYPWRKIAALLGADHKAIQRWHAQGIDMLVAAVNRGG